MNRIPLSEFAEKSGQSYTARILGVTQGALSKAIRQGRKIFIYQTDSDSFKAEEIRPFPNAKSALDQNKANHG